MKKNNLYGRIFGTAGKDELDQIVSEHPYFIPAHFFRLQASKAGDPDYDEKASKAALYFNDPFLMGYQGMSDKYEFNPETSTMKTPSFQSNSSNDDAFIFEPLHTTDYFASQGIRISAEIKEDDKLGRQLKSFTDWLKTMKKLPKAGPIAEKPVDAAVEKMAEKSNEDGEIVTESMAEVLVAQGKINRAAEVYRKLSLLYPAKSAYFATRLDSLKDT